MHPFIKAAGMKSEKEFYQKYKSPEQFFAAHPHMQTGGSFKGQGVLPDVMPGMYPGNMPVLMNQAATQDVYTTVPTFAQGGYHAKPGYFFDGTKMIKSKGSGTYANGVYFEQGGYPHPLNVPFDEFKKGGIHIKPENKGKFTAYKKRTGKTTEEALHSPDPHVRQMANFAKNAKKWHHKEEGGPINPFNPMYQYMQMGGSSNPWQTTGNSDETNQDIQSGRDASEQQVEQQTGQTPVMENDFGQQKPTVTSSNAPTNEEQMDGSQLNDPYSTTGEDDEEGTTKKKGKNGFVNWGAATLGIGSGILGAASILHDKYNTQKNQQMYMRDQNASVNGPRYINAFSKGTTDQYGTMPYNNFSQSPNVRTMQQGGGYKKNQVVDLSEAEINNLIRQGYKIQRM